VESFNDIIHGDGLTLVDFFATWCGPCQQMHPVLEQFKADMQDEVRVLKLDIDRNQSLASFYGIQSVPTLMLFRQGELLWRQSGTMPLDELKALVSQHRA